VLVPLGRVGQPLHGGLRLGVREVEVPVQDLPVDMPDPRAEHALRHAFISRETDEAVPERVQVAFQTQALFDAQMIDGRRPSSATKVARLLRPGGVAWLDQLPDRELSRESLTSWFDVAGLHARILDEQRGLRACLTRASSGAIISCFSMKSVCK